jgi:hypothetical protein
MSIGIQKVSAYLARYIEEYQKEYSRLISPPPSGGGYPQLEVSPYLYSNEITCWITENGVVIYDESREPGHPWWIAGGPTIVVDVEPSRTPPEVIDLLKREGLSGKNVGMYRIIAKQEISNDIWNGYLGPVIEEGKAIVKDIPITIRRTAFDQTGILQRLTFGAFEKILSLNLRGPETDFWNPYIVRRIGFCTADRKHRRFINYMEISPHLEQAAWDNRNIPTRVQSDIRRDYSWAFADPALKAGVISFGGAVNKYYDRLSNLFVAIERFAILLRESKDTGENVFHEFLRTNSIILDIYASAISKPRFEYPKGERSPLDKEYVEPDFLLEYSDGSYKLVELERPDKIIATKLGQPRSEFTQAAFQIAEFRDFIARQYDTIKDKYPGIATRTGAMIILSRNTEKSFGGKQNIQDYKGLLRLHHPNIEVLTYDDLLDRARYAYGQITASAAPR